MSYRQVVHVPRARRRIVRFPGLVIHEMWAANYWTFHHHRTGYRGEASAAMNTACNLLVETVELALAAARTLADETTPAEERTEEAIRQLQRLPLERGSRGLGVTP